MFQNVSECVRMCQNVSECFSFRMFQNVSEQLVKFTFPTLYLLGCMSASQHHSPMFYRCHCYQLVVLDLKHLGLLGLFWPLGLLELFGSFRPFRLFGLFQQKSQIYIINCPAYGAERIFSLDFFLISKLISTQCIEKEQKHNYGVYTSAISSIQKTFPRIDQSSRNSRENHKLCHTIMILLPPHYQE